LGKSIVLSAERVVVVKVFTYVLPIGEFTSFNFPDGFPTSVSLKVKEPVISALPTCVPSHSPVTPVILEPSPAKEPVNDPVIPEVD
jgi:hypothetical protein